MQPSLAEYKLENEKYSIQLPKIESETYMPFFYMDSIYLI